MSWFAIHDNQVKLTIYAKPHSRKTAVVGMNEQGMQIAIHALPQKGEANKELIGFLATLFDIPKKQIILLRGETSKYKQVMLPLTEKVSTFIKTHLAENNSR